MNNLITKNNAIFGKIRFMNIGGNPYAIASDVAKALGYKKPNNAINSHCKNATLKQGIIVDSMGRHQNALIIPEGDIYRLIVKSKLPQAKEFEKWIFEEVIPQIRQTGGYIPITEEMSDDEILARALIVAQKTLEKKELLLKQQKKQLKEKDDIIAIQKPMVEAYAQFIDAEGLINMDNAARIMNMGRNTLYKNLRDINILRNDTYYSNGRMKAGENHNLPYQSFMKYFKVKVLTKNGKAYKKLYVLPVGMDFIRKKLA